MTSIIQTKIPDRLVEIYQEVNPKKVLMNFHEEEKQLLLFRTALQNELDLINQLEKNKKRVIKP